MIVILFNLNIQNQLNLKEMTYLKKQNKIINYAKKKKKKKDSLLKLGN